MFDAYEELLKSEDVLRTIGRVHQTAGAVKLEACNHMRISCEHALGVGNCFVIGQGNNKTTYYGKNTVIGRANGAGIKIPGWHLPGFKLCVPGAE
jgi:hypothetical protein